MKCIPQNILALDLGTATGWAVRRRDGSMAYGTERFPNRKGAHPGQRWSDFRAWLLRVLHDEQIHVLTYELVIRHEAAGRPLWDAAHAYGAFQAVMHETCSRLNVECLSVNLATVKKSWTGNGRAKKEDMLAEARRRGFKPDTDNAADALAILSWATLQDNNTSLTTSSLQEKDL